jgi:uncharacterized membrane protein YedE/YeeE
MTINWDVFTPWMSLAGGVLLGLSTAIFIFMNGKIAGISGILGGVISGKSSELGWRAMFLIGLVASSYVYSAFATVPEAIIEASTYSLVLAGLLVGVGTRYAAGCTSGHGVVGLSRLSPRSLAATLSFMIAGFVVVFLIKHIL